MCADDQVIDLLVCTCEKDAKTCATRSTRSSAFGVGGILLMLLGLLLLLCKYRCFIFISCTLFVVGSRNGITSWKFSLEI